MIYKLQLLYWDIHAKIMQGSTTAVRHEFFLMIWKELKNKICVTSSLFGGDHSHVSIW